MNVGEAQQIGNFFRSEVAQLPARRATTPQTAARLVHVREKPSEARSGSLLVCRTRRTDPVPRLKRP